MTIALAPMDCPLLAAVRHAPRRHRLPPLPADAEAARACGAEVGVAYAVECLRRSRGDAAAVPPGTEEVFSTSLDALIRAGLSPPRGDGAFLALVLEEVEATVRAYRRLAASSASDWRAVRAAVDAIAHPGKLRGRPPGPLTERLVRLHRLATEGAADDLRCAAESVLVEARRTDPPLGAALEALHSHAALERLQRMAHLSGSEGVRRYLALLEHGGSFAPCAVHEAHGRAAERRGTLAETQTIEAFARIAALLNRRPGAPERFRAMRGLRTPRELPLPKQAKGEWDAVLVREAPGAGAAEIVLLAEVKAAPAATSDDLPTLRRGLQSLARAEADAVYTFTSTGDELPVLGASLRRLRPRGLALPEQVVYCCPAAPAARPRLLSPASKARLLAHPASLAHAGRLLRGEDSRPESLSPVWRDLHGSRAMRRVLDQYETARRALEALLHPDDLADEVERSLGSAASA